MPDETPPATDSPGSHAQVDGPLDPEDLAWDPQRLARRRSITFRVVCSIAGIALMVAGWFLPTFSEAKLLAFLFGGALLGSAVLFPEWLDRVLGAVGAGSP